MGDAARADIHDFHIIVPVPWKISKAGVGGNVHQPSGANHAAAVHRKFTFRRVTLTADPAARFQQSAFLGGDFTQMCEQILVHPNPPFCQSVNELIIFAVFVLQKHEKMVLLW